MDNRLHYYTRNPRALREEIVWGDTFMRWVYYSKATWLRERLFTSPALSRLMGRYFDSGCSKRRIVKFVREMDIDPDEFRKPLAAFTSFNDFFIRQLKPGCRPFDPGAHILPAAAEGRLLCFPVLAEERHLTIKGKSVSIADILPGDHAPFLDGSVVVIRLNPSDYHRFHFPCDCKIVHAYKIHGAYYSVNPIAFEVGLNPFKDNLRTVTLLTSAVFGEVAMVEVGASGVASIVQTHSGVQAQKMDEKGYFQFGGSTVILLFQKDKLMLDDDLVMNSAGGLETRVKVGETIGRRSGQPGPA